MKIRILGNPYLEEKDLRLEISKQTTPEGIFSLFKKSNGAFGLIIEENNKIYLLTDAMGKEQLYYHQKTLQVSDSITELITKEDSFDKIYFSNVLKFGYNYDNRTPYRNIKRCLPGELVIVSLEEKTITKKEEFDFDDSKPNSKSLKDLLIKKIKRLLNDVPKEEENIGVLLSGGIDSSIVASILLDLKRKNYFPQTLKFFSINNSEDERYIEIFENYFNVTSKRLAYNLSSMDEDTKKMILRINECPIDLGSLFPSYFLFKELQKENIKYVFTGDGPDEMFGGYNRIEEYDSQASDIFAELSFYHFPRLNKLAKYFGLILETPWVDDDIVRLALNLPFEKRKNKFILKAEFRKDLPEEIINRKKTPLKNDLIKENKRLYINDLVNLFYNL